MSRFVRLRDGLVVNADFIGEIAHNETGADVSIFWPGDRPTQVVNVEGREEVARLLRDLGTSEQ